MELDDIRRKAAAARCFEVVAGEVRFTLRIPTKHESSVAYSRVALLNGALDAAATIRWQRAVVAQAIVGWTGPKLRDVVPGHTGDEPVAFAPGLVELLLDARPAWEELLTNALLDEMQRRKAAEDTAAKN